MTARPTSIGTRIRQQREDRGWNQTELARRAGIIGSTLSRVENGDTLEPGSDFLSRVATALDVSVDSLLHGQPAPDEQDTSELRQLVSTRLGPSNAEKVETVVALLADKPSRDRDVVLSVIIDLIKTFPSLSNERTTP